MPYTLEICANSYRSALNAQLGGADRIELCSNLEGGGITPSAGLIRCVKATLRIPVFVLIRPRTGGFVYSDDEYEVMLEDIVVCKALGCEGVVIGVLTWERGVDVVRTKRLVDAARPMSVTFHRAIDECVDYFGALQGVLETGCDRALTSGGVGTVVSEEGMERVRKLIEIAEGRVSVMPGAGITEENLRVVAERTGAREFHTSAKVEIVDEGGGLFGASQFETSVDKVKALLSIIRDLERRELVDGIEMADGKK